MSRRRPTVVASVVALFVALSVLAPIGGGPLAAPDAGAAARTFGSEPLGDVLFWANEKKDCGLTRDQVAAMMITPTFGESGAPANRGPSPMALSRWDNQLALYAFSTNNGATRQVFFHPGIGMWQFDSAGFWNLTVATAINSYTSAAQAADVMVGRYCGAPAGWTAAQKRVRAWAPWFACTSGTTCENIYNSLLPGGVIDANLEAISRYGGMEMRTCSVPGMGTVSCGFVDPSRAQGYAAWNQPGFGPAPISFPFYVFEFGGREYRYWLKADTGYANTIEADKPVTGNARTTLAWNTRDDLCDQTAGRGSCGPTGPAWSAVNVFGGASNARPTVGMNVDGRQELFVVGTDGQLWRNRQQWPSGPFGSWVPMGCCFPLGATPAVGRNADGRLELFARGTDNAVWHAYQTVPGSGWTGFFSLGAVATADPMVASNADGRLEVWVLSTDNHQWHAYQTAPNSTWLGWFPFGGTWPAGTSLTSIQQQDGRLVALGVGTDGQVWFSFQTSPSGGFTGFFTLGGSFPGGRQVAPVLNADGRLEVFGVRADGTMWNVWQVAPNSPWSAFSLLSSGWGSGPDARRDNGGGVHVVAMGANGQLTTQYRPPSSPWLTPRALGGSGSSPPELGANADGRLEAFFTATNRTIHHAYQL